MKRSILGYNGLYAVVNCALLHLNIYIYIYICLPSHPSSIHTNHVSGNIIACLTGKEYYYPLEILGLPPSPGWDSRHDPCISILIIDECNVHISVDIPRRNCIHINALGSPLVG